MALYKANIQAIKPYKTHFREADILFTAKDDEQADRIAEDINRTLFVIHETKAEVNSVYKIG